MSDIKVSVIMPFYNGAEYVEETMNALMKQTLREIEIICVDDESTDGTYDKLLQYAKEDTRIIALHQKKSNAGAARNLGLAQAKGEYLLFLDSDDLYEENMLEKMYMSCKEHNADLCVCNADQYDVEADKFKAKPQYMRSSVLPESLPFSRADIGKHILYFTTSVPWNKMVRAAFVKENALKFQEIPRANDQYFSIMCLVLAQRITVVKDKLVHYKVNQKKNLTANYSETPLCSYESMKMAKEELQKRGLLECADVRQALDNKIINLLLYSLNIQRSLTSYCELYDLMKEEGFEQLGFQVQSEDYYFNKQEYKNLLLIFEHSATEYLLLKNKEYRGAIERKNIAMKDKEKEIQSLEKEIERLLKKEKELLHIKSTKRYKVIWKLSSYGSKLLGNKRKEKGND